MTAKSQTRPPRPIGNLVRFQAIGRRAAMTDIGARSRHSAALPATTKIGQPPPGYFSA
jgi:hypothetical protein